MNTNISRDLCEIGHDLQGYVQYLKRLGYKGVPLSEASVKILKQGNKGEEAGIEYVEVPTRKVKSSQTCRRDTKWRWIERNGADRCSRG